MRIHNKEVLSKAKKKYADTRIAIDTWTYTVENIHPKSFHELQQTFASVDLVGENEVLVCFNIKGNHYRMIVKMQYPKYAFVKEFLKHSDYNRKYQYKGRKK